VTGSGGFAVTHVAPREGLQVWRQPDPAGQVISQVQGGVQLQLLERRGAWARVAFSNGWSGWVDGRRIVEVGGPPPAAPTQPQPRPTQPQPVQPRPTQPQPIQPQPRLDAPPARGPSLRKREPSPFEPLDMPALQAPVRPTEAKPVPEPEPVPEPAPARPSPPSRFPALPTIGNVQITPALIGAAGVLLGTILSWIRIEGARSNAYDVPLAFLWDYKAGSDGGLKVGLLLLALAIFVGVFSVLPGQVAARRALGGVAIGVAVLYTIQLQRLLSAAGDAAPSLLSALGFGVLVTVASGVGIVIDRSEPDPLR